MISSLTDSSQPILQPCGLTSQEIIKRVNKDIKLGIHNINLLISLKHISSEIFDVFVKVKPSAREAYLPANLEIY